MTYALDYIDDAATARYVVYRRDGSVACDQSSNYEIPTDGIHLCGQTDDGEQPTTVAAYPMRRREARKLWKLAKGVAECSDEEGDFVVDLCIGDSIIDDFWSNRQLWPRAVEAWNAAQGIEAASAAETPKSGSVHESPVPNGDAPK